MSPSPMTIWQSYSCTELLYSSNYLVIWMYNYVIYAKTFSLYFQKWAVEYDITELADTVISTQDTIFHLRNLLAHFSIVFLSHLIKWTWKKNPNNFITSSKEYPFPLLIQIELGNASLTQETLSELSAGQTFILSTGIMKQSTHCALQAEVIQ